LQRPVQPNTAIWGSCHEWDDEDQAFFAAFFFFAHIARILSAAAFLCAGEKFRFLRAGASTATGAVFTPFDITRSGIDADFGGRPRLLAGVPPNTSMAAFKRSRSAIRSETIWSVGIYRKSYHNP
jgi:hypothetical protein